MSACKQSLSALEIIVVNDGSSDDTVAIVNSIDDPRVRVIEQINQGQSAAINTGVAHSSGKYIKLLDSDDWLNPSHLESQLEEIRDKRGVLASCKWGYFTRDPETPLVFEEYTNQSYDDPVQWLVDSLSIDQGMMGGWMWLIPREVWLRAGGYDTRLNLNNDFHFSIKLLLASNGVCFTPGAVYSYRKGSEKSLSGSTSRKAMESAFLTTSLGADLLLARENSDRIRQICADRFQQWVFQFFPEFPDLAVEAEKKIASLGGSDVQMQGGRLFNLLNPLLGWRNVRRLQVIAYKYGWSRMLERKHARRLEALN